MIELTQAPASLPPGRRIYAIGDIHGCNSQLGALHQAIADDFAERPVASALLLHIGDYVDRGTDTPGVSHGWWTAARSPGWTWST